MDIYQTEFCKGLLVKQMYSCHTSAALIWILQNEIITLRLKNDWLLKQSGYSDKTFQARKTLWQPCKIKLLSKYINIHTMVSVIPFITYQTLDKTMPIMQ